MGKFAAVVTALVMAAGFVLPAFAEAPTEPAIANIPEAVIDQEIAQAQAMNDNLTGNLTARSAILIDQETGQVLFAKNQDEKLAPASITKIMSLLLVMQALDQGQIALTDMVTCSDVAASMGGSQIWLEPGEQMSVDELLRAAAISSANDATVALAELVAGSEDTFVAHMNEEAARLGMTNTHFANSTGLDAPGHLSTAADIAKMSAELLKYPDIIGYTTVWMDSLRGGKTELVNTNRLVRFYQGATGLKTGTTTDAGCCLAASASRDNLSLVSVVLGCTTSDERFACARTLLDFGFSQYVKVLPEDVTARLTPVPVLRGVAREVTGTCMRPTGLLVERAKRDAVQQEIELAESVEAPVEPGQTIGRVVVTVEGEPLGEYPIVADFPVERMTLGKAFGILWRSALFLG